jgi:murein DD-endopeptidase MepM/ murein hydrolase activator NlpD
MGSSRVYSAYLHVKDPLPVGTNVDSNTVLARVNQYGVENSHLHWEIRKYASMNDSALPIGCKSSIGPSYTDTGTNPDDLGYINPSRWIESH